MSFVFKSQGELDKCLSYWTKELRLDDWDFKVSIVRGRDMWEEDKNAMLNPSWHHRTAEIQLRDPIDYPECFDEQDHEISLVHELCHLYTDAHGRFISDEDWNMSHQERERTCIAISRALVKLKRQAK